jgi:hypothetical protein
MTHKVWDVVDKEDDYIGTYLMPPTWDVNRVVQYVRDNDDSMAWFAKETALEDCDPLSVRPI